MEQVWMFHYDGKMIASSPLSDKVVLVSAEEFAKFSQYQINVIGLSATNHMTCSPNMLSSVTQTTLSSKMIDQLISLADLGLLNQPHLLPCNLY